MNILFVETFNDMIPGNIYKYRSVNVLYFIGQYKNKQTLISFLGGRYIELGDDINRIISKFDPVHLNIRDIGMNEIALSLLENSETVKNVEGVNFCEGVLVKSEIDDEIFMCFYSLENKATRISYKDEIEFEHYLVSLKTGLITQVKDREAVFKKFLIYDVKMKDLEINIKGI